LNQSGQGISSRSIWSSTYPLHLASLHGSERLTRLLLDKGAHVDINDKKWGTALMLACAKGYIDVGKLLLDYGAPVSPKCREYDERYDIVDVSGSHEHIRYIFDGGLGHILDYGDTALSIASRYGRMELFQLLLEKGASSRTIYGEPLQVCSYWGWEKQVQELLENGAEVNAQGGRYGNALQAASAQGHVAIVEMLLKQGADPRLADAHGWDSMLLALQNKHEMVVAKLSPIWAAERDTMARPSKPSTFVPNGRVSGTVGEKEVKFGNREAFWQC
jgi:ankyrin repeat protein